MFGSWLAASSTGHMLMVTTHISLSRLGKEGINIPSLQQLSSLAFIGSFLYTNLVSKDALVPGPPYPSPSQSGLHIYQAEK